MTDIRTRAELQEDGSYRITGNKMWITGGEHELSENIIHMVLAKIPGGPPGVKGISLLDMLGHVVAAWMWLKQAVAAQAGISNAEGADRQFYEGKMQACRYFFRWELPKINAQAGLLSALDTTCLDMPEEAF